MDQKISQMLSFYEDALEEAIQRESRARRAMILAESDDRLQPISDKDSDLVRKREEFRRAEEATRNAHKAHDDFIRASTSMPRSSNMPASTPTTPTPARDTSPPPEEKRRPVRKLAEIVGYGFIALVFIVGVIWAIDGGKRFWNDHGPAIQEAIDDIRPDFEFNFCIGEGCPDDESSDPDSTAAPQSIDEEALATLIAQKVVNDLRPEFANLATQEDVTNVEYKLDSILNQVIQGNTSIADLQTMLTNLRTDVSGLEGDAATAIQPAIDLLSDIVTRLKNGGTFTQADWNEFLGEWTTFIESRRGHYHRDNPAPRGTPDLGPIPSTNP